MDARDTREVGLMTSSQAARLCGARNKPAGIVEVYVRFADLSRTIHIPGDGGEASCLMRY